MSGPVPIEEGFFRAALAGIVPYEPGKPVEEVQRELGLERVVKLASNEGPFGPFPAALDALARSAKELNRYPDGGAYALRAGLAERHGVRFEEIAIGSGADGVVDTLSQAVLEPGDGVVLGWPSFPSYAIYAAKTGADVRKVPLRDQRYDLDAMLGAIDGRTKLAYVCHPNNPTGTMNTRAELDAFLDRVPGHVLVVVDQAYFEYVDDPEYLDAVAEYFRAGRRVAVLRTFSKIYGLAGLRVGYAVAPAELVTALSKTRRAFDVASSAQAAALASLDSPDEVERRRRLNAEGLVELDRVLRENGLDPAEPAVANFLYADVEGDARTLFEHLLRLGVVVRPLAPFGAPGAIRVTVGTRDEHAILAEALGRTRDRVTAPS
ncbi:MAG: histidinol-phosphate transaminase [Actinomycetota bacterium]|nr:histidinol-phosphate transaminase [Actinomycetota bacterium]